jgi:hypothetical protein
MASDWRDAETNRREMMYALVNDFDNGDRIISRHRTIAAAVLANKRLQRLTAKNNGSNSYLPTRIKRIVKGELVSLTMREEQEAWEVSAE